ncbi:MAG: hypothetical protein ACK559_14530, partial [bacterium]
THTHTHPHPQKYRIVEINCNKSCFTAIFTLHLRWQDFTLTEEEFNDNKAWRTNWQPRWTPSVRVFGALCCCGGGGGWRALLLWGRSRDCLRVLIACVCSCGTV